MTENANPEDTGQISVAELLARNGQKSTTPSSGGRRRRGVKGGISVAELTGEIPVVRAEPASEEAPVIATPAPASPRPTPAPPTPAPPTAASTTAASTAAASTAAQKSGQRSEPELLSGSTTAAGDLLNRSHDETERRASSQQFRAATPTERPSRSSGFVPRPRPQQPRRAQPKQSQGDDEPRTEVTPRPVVPKPVVPQPAAKPAVAKSAVAKPVDISKADKTSTPNSAPNPVDDAPTEVADAVTAGPSVEEQAAVADTAEPDTKRRSRKDRPSEKDRPSKKDAVKQWLVLVGQGVVAVIVGALLFKGFERLWDMLPWVALILAVLVIVGLVAVVRILRRTDDMLSMVIAIVVGVFVTLGPLAFQLSTG